MITPTDLEANHLTNFRNWEPGKLRDEPAERHWDLRVHDTAVDCMVTPTKTTINTIKLLAKCPDPEEHVRRTAEAGEVCPDCALMNEPPQAGKTPVLTPLKACEYHPRHDHCHVRSVHATNAPEDAVVDDDGQILQEGVETGFTHPAPGKLRRSWDRSPRDERLMVNGFIETIREHLADAEKLGEQAARIMREGDGPAAVLARMKESIEHAVSMDEPSRPAYDHRHFRERMRRDECQKLARELEKAAAMPGNVRLYNPRERR